MNELNAIQNRLWELGIKLWKENEQVIYEEIFICTQNGEIISCSKSDTHVLEIDQECDIKCKDPKE